MAQRKVWKLLDDVGCDSVYQFLGKDEDASLEELRAAAERKYASIHNQSSRSDVARSGAALAGLCRSDVFKNARSRDAHDREAARRSAKSRGEAPPPVPFHLNVGDAAQPIVEWSGDAAKSIYEWWMAKTAAWSLPLKCGVTSLALGVVLLLPGALLNALGIPILVVLGGALIQGGLLVVVSVFVWRISVGWVTYNVKRIFRAGDVMQCQSCGVMARREVFARGHWFDDVCPGCGSDLPPLETGKSH